MSKKIAKAQQDAVTDLEGMLLRLDVMVDGIRPSGKWFPAEDFGFVEGQINTMLGIAAQQIREALSAFEDCCEDGVKFMDRA